MFAAQRGTMPEVEGCLKSVTSNDDAVAEAMKAEDELILNEAMSLIVRGLLQWEDSTRSGS